MKAERDKEGFIVGIHNYCHRWCEKCSFTSACRIYRSDPVPGSGGEASEAFYQEVLENFSKAIDMLHEMAREHGIDLEALEAEVQDDKLADEEAMREAAVTDAPSNKLAMEYLDLLDEWMTDNQQFFEEKSEELQQQVQLNPENGKPIEQAVKVRDSLEILKWYATLVPGKVYRALASAQDDELFDDPIQTDSNGSAKAAVLGLEASLGAMEVMRSMFPEKTDDWLGLMAHLQRTIRAIETRFPNARKFMRPGFDVMPEA